MALPQAISSTTTLVGGLQINYSFPPRAAMQDLGGKVAGLISTVNALVSAINIIQSAIVSANASGVTFSAFSSTSAGLTSYSVITNFTSN
jgi:hypothetical protein